VLELLRLFELEASWQSIQPLVVLGYYLGISFQLKVPGRIARGQSKAILLVVFVVIAIDWSNKLLKQIIEMLMLFCLATQLLVAAGLYSHDYLLTIGLQIVQENDKAAYASFSGKINTT
jgi:hypothetical protein